MEIIIGVFSILLLVVSVLIVCGILLQEDKSGGGMGILGGSSQSFFGASSSNFLVRATSILLVIFIIFGVALAILCSTQTSETTITTSDIQKKQYEGRTMVDTKQDYIKNDMSSDKTKK